MKRISVLIFAVLCVMIALFTVSCECKHSLVKVDQVDATEEKDGYRAYWQCGKCDKMFSDANGNNEISERVVIEKMEHEHMLRKQQGMEPTYESDGYEEYWKCSLCKKLYTDSGAKVQIKEPIVIPRLDNTHKHNMQFVKAVPATCTKEGAQFYWICDGCGNMYVSADGKEQITAPAPISMIPHALVVNDKVEPTEFDAGTEKYYTCEVCEKMFSDEQGKNEITSPVPISPLTHTHTLSMIDRVDSTCETQGTREYWKCSNVRCGKMFSDKDGKNQLTSPEKLPLHNAVCYTSSDKKWTKCRDCRGVLNDESSLFTPSQYTYETTNTSVNYQVYIPDNAETRKDKLPLILFLHGAGERGDNNTAQLNNAIRIPFSNNDTNYVNSVVIAPQCPIDKRWVEWDWNNGNYNTVTDEVDESELLHAVYELVKEYSEYDYIDETRIYVMGLSMGGFGTWNLLANHSDLFAAGVPICGGAPIDKVNVLKDVPIYTFHGTADTTVPYSTTTPVTVQAIKEAGGTLVYCHEFEGAGHIIWDDAIVFSGDTNSPNVTTWLFSQKKTVTQ